jgi:hypothetical protein
MNRIAHLAAVAAAVTLGLVSATALATPTVVLPYPNSMAAIGDLLTLDDPLNPNPPHSWSTGTSPALNSHYRRILAANPAINGKNYNFTPLEIDLTAQARKAVAKRVDYVTIGPIEDNTCEGMPSATVGRNSTRRSESSRARYRRRACSSRALATSRASSTYSTRARASRASRSAGHRWERAPRSWRGCISGSSPRTRRWLRSAPATDGAGSIAMPSSTCR